MSQEQVSDEGMAGRRKPQTSNGLIAIIAVLVSWIFFSIVVPVAFQCPPSPLPVSADSKLFSAERGSLILKRLVGDGIPHPAGSAQNDIVRERIVTMFEEFGYEPEIQKTSCSRQVFRSAQVGPASALPSANDGQGPVLLEIPLENIMARLPGKSPGKAILLTAHYDSVPQGPGASDDGVGMAAVLEIARMLRSEGPMEHDVIFLITDGEEIGLAGAKKFVAEHQWAKEVQCVINLEARGICGPSFMFETSKHSRWLIPILNQSIRRPLTSSLFYEVYKVLPNNTDFTIYKAAQIQGYNFAFIGNVNAYHTAEDNFENVSLSSFQHHGENMLGLVRTLGELDFEKQPTGQVVYFDLLGWKVIYWPADWSLPFSLVGIALICAAGFFSAKHSRHQPSFGKIILGLMFVLGTAIASVAIGLILKILIAYDGVFEPQWPNFPWPVHFTFYLFTLTIGASAIRIVHNWVSANLAWMAVYLIWGIMALAVSLTVCGASHLFIVPVLMAGILGLISYRNDSQSIGAVAGAVSCGLMWLPLEAVFYDALGFTSIGVTLLPVRSTIVGLTALPLFAGLERQSLNRVLIGLSVAGAICLLLCLVMVGA